MRLFIILRKIAYKLHLIADYVVEENTDGDWYYRKYQSGYIELYGTVIIASGTWSGSSPLYYGSGYKSYPLLFALTGYYSCKWTAVDAEGAIVWFTAEQVRADLVRTIGYPLRAYGGTSSVNMTIKIEITGTYK